MQDVVVASVAERRFQMALVGVLGILALILAVVGIYGVTSYTVSRRIREIGLRVALGAQRREVVRAVMVEGLRPVLIGLAIGVIGGQLASQSIRAALFGIGVVDPATLVGVATVLLLTAILACYVPARRATRIDPIVAMRTE
jgi:putative ABC transport system permease protein